MKKLTKNNLIIIGFLSTLILVIGTIFIVSTKNEDGSVSEVDVEDSSVEAEDLESEDVESEVASEPNDVSDQELPLTVTEYVDIQDYGAIADANYYNEEDNTYYQDKDYTIEATDNTEAFTKAFNSGFDILVPEGNWFVDGRVTITEGPEIKADDAVIYTRSSAKYKYLFYIKGNGTRIIGMTVKTTLDQIPLILNKDPEPGIGSNVFAFVVEANDVLIDHVITENVCRGVNKGTQVFNTNLIINESKFYNATIPVFAFYIDGMKITKSYLEANDSGLGAGFHSLYLSAYAKNVEVIDCTLVFNTENNGGIIQLYSSKEVDEPIIENITIKNTVIDSKASHLLVLGRVKGLLLDNITFTKHESYTNGEINYGKIMYLHDYVYDVTIQNSTLDFYDTSSVMTANVQNYGNIVIKDNNISTNLTQGTNLFTTLFDYTVDNNVITINERTGGNVFGFSGGGIVTFSNNIVKAETKNLILGSGSGDGYGTLNLTNNQFFCDAKDGGICFYDNMDNQVISAIGNTFVGFDQLVQDATSKTVTDLNNIFKKATNE